MARKKLEGAKRFGPRSLENDRILSVGDALHSSDNSGGPKARLNFSDVATRKKLTPVAIKAFVRLVAIWELTDSEAVALSGISTRRTWRRIKNGEWSGTLSQDHLTRLSSLIGIYKGLNITCSDAIAKLWIRKRNTSPLFHGQAPLDFLIIGGIPAFLDTRSYICDL